MLGIAEIASVSDRTLTRFGREFSEQSHRLRSFLDAELFPIGARDALSAIS